MAREAGVSRTTAAKVLLGTGGDHVRVGTQARERVEQAAERLEYRPNRAAQRLAGGQTQTLGVLMDTVNAPVMNDRLAAIEKEAAGRGYRLLIGQIHNSVKVLRDYLADFDSRGVDAIFCLFDVTRDRVKRLRPILGDRSDFVLHGKPLDQGGHCVRVDTASAIADLINHLAGLQRMRIGLQLENMNDELMAIRQDAYTVAMSSHGRAGTSALIWADQREEVHPTAETINDAITQLVEQGRADAIVASNDIWAARLIQALKARDYRVPEDVAVTGYDNLDLATIIDPALTTIDQEHAKYAKAALDLMLAIASKTALPEAQRTVTIEPKMLIRASTLRQ